MAAATGARCRTEQTYRLHVPGYRPIDRTAVPRSRCSSKNRHAWYPSTDFLLSTFGSVANLITSYRPVIRPSSNFETLEPVSDAYKIRRERQTTVEPSVYFLPKFKGTMEVRFEPSNYFSSSSSWLGDSMMENLPKRFCMYRQSGSWPVSSGTRIQNVTHVYSRNKAARFVNPIT